MKSSRKNQRNFNENFIGAASQKPICASVVGLAYEEDSMNDDDINYNTIITCSFADREPHKILGDLRMSVDILTSMTGVQPKTLRIDKETYESRIKFMEKAINEMGLTVEIEPDLPEE